MSNNLTSLLESLLNEDKLSDFYTNQKEKYPNILNQINYLERNKVPANYASWIIKQINVNSPEPVEDILPLIYSFEKNKGKLDKKDIVLYKNTSELNRSLEDLNQQKQEKQLQKTTIKSSNIQDVLAEKDGWYVTFPHTTEASCDLGKSTTWCTARTQSGNMFLNYVAAKQDIILFYVINPNLNVFKEPFAKMSIGYVQGEPKFDMGDNQLTVNSNNDNLTQEKFTEVVGPENASLFLNAMSRKAKQLGGIHPAQKEMEAIAQNYDLFLKKVATYKDTEQNYKAKKEFFRLLKKYKNDDLYSDDIENIEEYIKKFKYDIDRRRFVAASSNTNPEILSKLSKDIEIEVRRNVANNNSTSSETLLDLATENDTKIQYYVTHNFNVSPEALKILSASTNADIRGDVAKQQKTDPATLVKLSKDPELSVVHKAFLNRNFPLEILQLLVNEDTIDLDLKKLINYIITDRLENLAKQRTRLDKTTNLYENKLQKLIKEMVEESFIDEMPIGKVTRIGDFNKSSSIRNPIDRALLSNPKAEVKMRSIWQNSKGNFDLVFVNDPRVNKFEFREIGPVSLDFVRNKMRLSEEELPIDPDATTIIYTNNSGDYRVMSSSWILAHRLGHSIASAREGTSNDYLATLWREFTQKLTTLFRDMLNNVYDLQPSVRGLTGKNRPYVEVTDQEVFKLAAQSLGTMKSARDNKLSNWYEFAYELFAQYLLYGKINLNPIPDSILTKVRGFVKNKRNVRDKESQEMYNRHDLQYYTEELESTLDYLIEELAGTIFVM